MYKSQSTPVLRIQVNEKSCKLRMATYSASSVIRTSIIRILDYPNKPDGRLRHCKTCLRMRILPTVVGVADFCSVRSSRDCGQIAPVSFIKDMTKPKRKKKALSITKYGSTLYIGMDEVLAHYACTFEISNLHFHFQ